LGRGRKREEGSPNKFHVPSLKVQGGKGGKIKKKTQTWGGGIVRI
jgi:hypothetical protein